MVHGNRQGAGGVHAREQQVYKIRVGGGHGDGHLCQREGKGVQPRDLHLALAEQLGGQGEQGVGALHPGVLPHKACQRLRLVPHLLQGGGDLLHVERHKLVDGPLLVAHAAVVYNGAHRLLGGV